MQKLRRDEKRGCIGNKEDRDKKVSLGRCQPSAYFTLSIKLINLSMMPNYQKVFYRIN
jgi:hypothetical protein